MLYLSQKLDQLLLELAWSLWTELGVSGHVRKHKHYLITPEELILLTISLEDTDPRLRDESLDWCSQYHHLISVSRLKTLVKDFDELLIKSFSSYSATLNHISPKAGWPIYLDSEPLKVFLSHKSCLRPRESPALLNIRARSVFSTGARADLLTFFLTHKQEDFAVSDLVEIGYSKRNLAEILDELNFGGIFDKFMVRNQNRYRLKKSEQLINILKPIPDCAPSWRLIINVLLFLRDCIKHTEKKSETTQVVEIRNKLIVLENTLQKLNLIPPSFQADLNKYLKSFNEWLLQLAYNISEGTFR